MILRRGTGTTKRFNLCDVCRCLWYLARLFKVAVTVENEALACWVLGKMQKTDLNDRHVQLLVQKTLEPHVQRAAQYGMGEHPATLPNVRKVANSLLPYTLAHAP